MASPSAVLMKSRAESAVNERKKFFKLLWEQEDLSSNCLSLYMTSAMFYNILLCSSARLKEMQLRIHSWEQVSQYVSFRKLQRTAGWPSDVRKNISYTLRITLNAIESGGNQSIQRYPDMWETRLCLLGAYWWSKTNRVGKLWKSCCKSCFTESHGYIYRKYYDRRNWWIKWLI